MALPKLQKDLLREQLDKHVTFANSLTQADKMQLEDFELEQIGYDAALQHRGNFLDNRRGRVAGKYRDRYGLGDIIGKENGTEEILPQEYIAVYMEKYPESVLEGKELEDAALAEFIIEQDSIDVEINGAIIGNGDPKFSTENVNISQFKATKRGIREKLDNLKRAVVEVNWKE